ncbi:MAG TPA: T9SS type A sorting domain-containing protein, partial [Bacteroidia bacterium]|nr:T9SS type A sorting domain-containing protein [Bacteroidia bacterium]
GFADLTLTAVITGSVMNVSTTAKPAIDLNGTYQLALVITEDSVHNTASTYAQHNYYSSTSQNQPLVGAGHNWQTSPNPIPAAQMWFDHVARVIVGSFTGQTGSLPTSMVSGTTYNYSFNNVPLTSTWNTNKLTADLLLIDVTTGQILNSKSVTPTISVGIKTESNYKNVTVYPNPTNNNFNVNVTLNAAQKATVSLCNITGQVMLTNNYNFNAGENLINISTDQLACGMYTLLISSESGVHITKVSIVK